MKFKPGYSMKTISCDGCGVVIDSESFALVKRDMVNHDGDKICEHFQCPVCKTWIPNGDRKEIK